VLEIGAGTGTNLPYYGADVHLALLEPSPYMARRLEQKAQALGRRATVVQESGERLPFADAAFDSVVCTFVLCSVDDVPQVLREVRRVLRPGGAFYFLEHVAAPGGWTRRLQAWLTPAQRLLVDGCRLDRDTGLAIQAAGFSHTEVVAHRFTQAPPWLRPGIYGVAWK